MCDSVRIFIPTSSPALRLGVGFFSRIAAACFFLGVVAGIISLTASFVATQFAEQTLKQAWLFAALFCTWLSFFDNLFLDDLFLRCTAISSVNGSL